MFPKKALRHVPAVVAGLLAGALVLSACSSDDGGSPTQGIPGAAQNNQQGNGGAPAQPINLTIAPAGGKNVNPATPIVVKASNGKLVDVTVKNKVKGTVVKGETAADGLSWTSSEPLGYGATYTVTAHAQPMGGGDAVEKTAELTTLQPDKLANPNMIPAPSSVKSTGIGVGQPIVFQFSYPVQNKAAVEKQLKVESSPEQEGGWYWIDDKNVHYRPKEYWQANTTIKVTAKVYGVDFGNGVFGSEDREETYKVHDAWVAKADGNTHKMKIYKNGDLVKTMDISLGKGSTPTHVGPHVISDKHEDYVMDSCTYGVCKGDPNYYRSHEKWSQRISNDGEFVHENPNSVSAQGNTNVSHGCINLNGENAQWAYQHLGIGDVVEVTNSGGPKLPLWDLYGDWELSWSAWQQGSAIK
ncbi:lipoprotein-anchoring transpeptidase ErfK/SrfK [Labedaea rhizosphaerae]|uniref:Lipoprotein-anchoring transpeptidase ErfK/SrfK n=1 Tax=Labedaea rhizosphaerae TaxID=598644 RepID=A0A4R6S2X5_LABRH|nr:Ig-like domain-containing protein [Labedaea rhizosphaerae]TDP93999.1 lipoprotein-anchoring transpeptidase ErfK/SrfK [Labedaea rhizosphaerae]